MNTLMGSGRNIVLEEIDGEIKARIEVVVIVGNPVYAVDSRGIAKSEKISDIRFMTPVKGLRDLLKTLEEVADEAVALEASVSICTEEQK